MHAASHLRLRPEAHPRMVRADRPITGEIRMTVTDMDKQTIRSLATRVAEIAADPVQQEKRDMWVRLNRLERVRPLIHVQAIAWNIWEELIPPETLEATDDWVRSQELALRRKVHCWEHFRDDRVVDDVIVCPIVTRGDIRNIGFGIEKDLDRPEDRSGSHAFRSVIVEERDVEKIRTESEVTVDHDATEREYERLCDLYGDSARVEKRGEAFFWFSPMDQFITWRGVEQMFVDLLERPAWVHEALERIIAGYENTIEQLESLGVLAPGNDNQILGSGGYAFTDQLPQPDFDGEHVRLKDIWARAATQIFTDGVSPDMHDEFAVQYEKRLLERFGLSCYGCCEPLDRKMHVVRQIKNLRRVSMSPWVDIERAAAAVGKDYVYTHKPNPAIVSMEQWHPDLAREQLVDMFERTRENILEVNLQDLHTLRGEPGRLTEWTQMALELAEQYA
jgi:hypothetical protein